MWGAEVDGGLTMEVITAATDRSSVGDDAEASGWREFGFVQVEGRTVVSSWSPLILPEHERERRYSEANRIGSGYAVDLVGHIKRYPDRADRLVEVMREMVAAGDWGGVEIGFCSALAGYIAEGRVQHSADFVIIDLRRAA